jgi:predicted nuclease of predicted toxin-antitoxin system
VTEPTLFIRLYLDEDVSVFVAQLLRPHGFDVLTTKDAQKLGSTDAAQLRYAATQRLTLLTHNRVDFERLHTEALQDQKPHAGILIANDGRRSRQGICHAQARLIDDCVPQAGRGKMPTHRD